MTHIAHLMNDWVYYDYYRNREKAPSITTESWRKVYGPEVDAMEARYQADKAIAKAQS